MVMLLRVIVFRECNSRYVYWFVAPVYVCMYSKMAHVDDDAKSRCWLLLLSPFHFAIEFYVWVCAMCIYLCVFVQIHACMVCLLCSNDQFQYTLQELVYFSGLHLFPFGCLTLFSTQHIVSKHFGVFFFIIKKLSTTQNYPFVSQSLVIWSVESAIEARYRRCSMAYKQRNEPTKTYFER